MPLFNVSYDLIIPGVYTVNADDEEDAEKLVSMMRPDNLLKGANTEEGEVCVDGVAVCD